MEGIHEYVVNTKSPGKVSADPTREITNSLSELLNLRHCTVHFVKSLFMTIDLHSFNLKGKGSFPKQKLSEDHHP